jgi:hypothetical protein
VWGGGGGLQIYHLKVLLKSNVGELNNKYMYALMGRTVIYFHVWCNIASAISENI